MVLLLTPHDVKTVLSMKDCMDVVEKAFIELAEGSAVMPLRTTIPASDGTSFYMPAYLKKMEALACKVVTAYKDNPAKHNLPTTLGKVLLQDPETGAVICIMDGGYLTAVRTGAASGVGTKYLAREDSGQVAGIFGAGVQARMQLWAMKEARDINKAFVYDRSEAAAKNFATEMGEGLDLEVVVAKHPGELLASDIICAATSSSTPLFNGADVREGTHINGIGSHTPVQRELDTTLVKRSLFVGDSREACFGEAGDLLIPIGEGAITEAHFHAELGEIISGKKQGRKDDKMVTLFKSTGLAIQDTATAKLVYERAKAADVGLWLEL